MRPTESFDFVIFGAGFGGSILSMVLRKLGYSVVLLERGAHPRFAIGESSTPFANLLLERLATEYDLPFLRAFSEWGTWQKTFPKIGCGLKRGFTFYHHVAGRPVDFQNRNAQLLVAASPNDAVADTHWYRPDFDFFLVQQAQKQGVTYLDRAAIEACEHSSSWSLRVARTGEVRQIRAQFAVDASGAGGFLSDYLRLSRGLFDNLPPTHAVYAHFRNVARLDDLRSFHEPTPPYPPDDAAVHHVFAEGWIWVLRFNNGVTSAGAALKSSPGRIVQTPEEIWNELLDRFPTLKLQFASATTVTPFSLMPQLSFRRSRAAGPDWAFLPSAAGFVDPLLSTGFALNLLGISRLARLFAERTPDQLPSYATATLTELDAAADLISAMYHKMHSFEEYAALSLLYFAAMSYSETAWRLGKPERASMFLLSNDAAFTKVRTELSTRARSGAPISLAEAAEMIEPWDIAGLGDLTRRKWYPVSFGDLINGCQKLGATSEEMNRLLAKMGVLSCDPPLAMSTGALL